MKHPNDNRDPEELRRIRTQLLDRLTPGSKRWHQVKRKIEEADQAKERKADR